MRRILLVRLPADQSDGLLPGDPAQGLDLFADGGAQAGHRQRPPWTDLADRRASAARTRNSTAERGEACQCRTVSGTGSTASWPTSGSRRMLEKNPDAAWLGLPGRMQMVGSRIPMPSTNPRRV